MRNNIFSFLLLFFCAFISACSSTTRATSTPGYEIQQTTNDKITSSLFNSNDRTISEENIQRLLDGQIELGDSLRLAVYQYASSSTNRYGFYNDEEYLNTQQGFIDTMVYELKRSDRIQKVILIPPIMIDNSPNITELREAAVRLQADVLLIYAINSDTYYKFKAFQKNESKAFATCQSLLMDCRTGVIPHSEIITKEHFVRKENEDWTAEETRNRAENGAVIKSLVESGKSVVAFLNAF
ncbi:MAG: hypothetical protein AAF598_19560 [Bacteroidota bacterium]